MSHRQTSPHTRAAKASLQHIGPYILITLEQLLWRVISLSPLIFAMISGQFFGVQKDYVFAAALLSCIPLWVLLVLPARFRAGAQVSAWYSADIAAGGWSDRLARGLRRLAVTLPFLLPVFAYLAVLYYYMYFTGFNSFFMLIESAGKLVGGNFVVGLAILALLLVVLSVLAFLGWRRYMMPHFYLPENEQVKSMSASPLKKTILINFLIVLPPLALVLAILGLSLAPNLSGSVMFDTLTIVSAVTQFDFPAATLYQCLWVLLIAYLPFVLLRKAAIAAVYHPQK